MCGITGFVINGHKLEDNFAKGILLGMCKALEHRGPDDEGVYLSSQAASNRYQVGLGHRRLSIIDLTEKGHQPMSNEDNSIWLSYNGEIYNFIELRDYLIKKGHVFRSKTDTEVILHGYEEWGKDVVTKLNGMFGFALWDEKRSLLLLARDRMGEKPIYYALIKDGIVFGSEPKAILKFPGFEKEIDHHALFKYFLYEYVPSPDTIYRNMNRLEAGSLLIFKDNKSILERYWDISFDYEKGSGHEKKLRDLLKDAVIKRLVSDVPLGVFLSGGIDSSYITSLMSASMDSGKIKTFTIGFKDKSFDESRYGGIVAEHFKTDHHEKILEPLVTIDLLSSILDFIDEPFGDASIIPAYLLSKYTKQFVTVALSGDGGDELFCGYDTFKAHRLANVYEKAPVFLRKYLIEQVINGLPVSLDNISFDFKLKRFIKGIPYKTALRDEIWLGSFSPGEQISLFQEGMLDDLRATDVFQGLSNSLKNCNAKNYIDMLTYIYCKFYLQDDILLKTDRASMACSLEARAPFLDHRVVEYACSIPNSMKLRGLSTKYILRKSIEGSLPSVITRRPKKGFGVPVAKWIKCELKDLILGELGYEKIKRENILNPGYIQKILKEHFDGIKDNRKEIWTIFMFELWHKRWITG